MKPKAKKSPKDSMRKKQRVPALFIGHGNPMNAIEDNDFTLHWQQVGKSLPRPKAILCVSAHWQTWGTLVTAMESPRTIHDFGGFPPELYQAQYPAPGSSWLAGEIRNSITGSKVGFDLDRGLDHGCWSVLKRMFPAADLPVVQLSLDYTKSAIEHYNMGREMANLRDRGILILASGNMVHNLERVEVSHNGRRDFNRPLGFDWAIEANNLFKKLIDEDRSAELADFHSLGHAAQLAVPSPEHFLPLLYALALKQKGEKITYFNDKLLAGSIAMTSFIIK
ncbi:MAG: 4,5-DOPA dioxygenase extradiol [Chrysiogenales bacterium]|nr:4,5-DOPA dioxygenase extradiol [Candidatus Aminicenantes bacterium]TFG80543.1 MAG: 4,5-DOPA dioxygenase extradiol [Chrysiogenales bacterium]